MHPLKKLLGAVSFPLFVLVPTAFAIHALQGGYVRHSGLPAWLSELIVYFGAVLPAIAVIALLERVLPHRTEWNRARGDVPTDAAHLMGSYAVQSLMKPFVVALGTIAAGSLSTTFGANLWPAEASLWIQLPLALLIHEFGHYWWHRFGHEHPWGWRLHATHHSVERLYFLNATRFHAVDIAVFQVASVVPLVALGMPRDTFVVFGVFVFVFGHLQHSNIDFRTGPLRYVLSTPELHRYHHSRVVREGNTNYGGDLVLWDQLFGTFYSPKWEIFSGEPGLDGPENFPKTFWAQQLSAFRWHRLTHAAETSVRTVVPAERGVPADVS